jgi:cytochrome P450
MLAGVSRQSQFPLGAEIELAQLEFDPHPLLARLREHEPVSWVPALDGWLVTRHDLALEVMRDAHTFTVDDPRFSTAQVIGPSMLSLDGDQHARHRAPFVGPFRAVAVQERFAGEATDEAERLIEGFAPAGAAELRRSFAGPLAAAIVARALGLDPREVPAVLAWYDAIVTSVTRITAGEPPTREGAAAFLGLRERLEAVISDGQDSSLLAAAAWRSPAGPVSPSRPESPSGSARGPASDPPLSHRQIVSNAAVLLFGGIETTEGMIANLLLHLLERPELVALVRNDAARLEAAIDESLRLEPAAAVIDRYATADATLGGASIARGELVRISISAANRDPAVFPHPDAFDLERGNLRRHLAFAQGPHVCVGVHLARLEARVSVGALLRGLPRLRLDPARRSAARGLVFRKPPRLDAIWTWPVAQSPDRGDAGRPRLRHDGTARLTHQGEPRWR